MSDTFTATFSKVILKSIFVQRIIDNLCLVTRVSSYSQTVKRIAIINGGMKMTKMIKNDGNPLFLSIAIKLQRRIHKDGGIAGFVEKNFLYKPTQTTFRGSKKNFFTQFTHNSVEIQHRLPQVAAEPPWVVTQKLQDFSSCSFNSHHCYSVSYFVTPLLRCSVSYFATSLFRCPIDGAAEARAHRVSHQVWVPQKHGHA